MALEGGSSGHCQHIYWGMLGWSRAGGHLGTPSQRPCGTGEPRHLHTPPGPGRVGAHIQHLQLSGAMQPCLLPWAPPVPSWSCAEDARTRGTDMGIQRHPTPCLGKLRAPKGGGQPKTGIPLDLHLLQLPTPLHSSLRSSAAPLPQHSSPQKALIGTALRGQNKFLPEAGVLHTPRDAHTVSAPAALRAENILLPVPSTTR